MRGYMQGALGALFAYGAAWWGAGDGAATSIDDRARGERVVVREVDGTTTPAPPPAPTTAAARAAAPAPSTRLTAPAARASATGALPTPPPRERAPERARDPLAGIASLPPDLGPGGSMPATADSLRQLAEYRQLAESPAALVERVERYEPSPEQLAEFRRVAAQLFNARPAGSEGDSPWAPGGTRDGQGSVVQRADRSTR